MTGKELVARAMRGETVERIPWVPFVGCHAASLVGVSARDYLKSADLIVKGVEEAIRRYRPDGIPVMFDLQIEAEALGCELAWADENPPAVSSHPLVVPPLTELSVPAATQGRFPAVLEATRRLAKAHPDLALYGLVTGPFTLALHLLGPNVFMHMYDSPEQLTTIMAFCREVALQTADYYLDAGCDVIGLVDPMTSQIGPEHFRQFVTPYVAPIFSHVRSRGKLSSFFVCGHAQANIEEMCATRPDNISIDENIQLAYVRDLCRSHGVSFGGNMQLTVVLLFGTKEDCLRNAMDCMTIGGKQGFILAPGCDIPFATPDANLEAVAKLVHDPYEQEVARAFTLQGSNPEINLDMSDYGKLDKVVIDIITLDSEACAPCQYMVEAVKAVMPMFEDLVIWREHKIKRKDSVEFMTAMMVRNVPTICIDGDIVFVSRIPSRDEMTRAIQDRILKKLRRHLRQYSAKVILLGGGTVACDETKENLDQAIRELGIQVAVEHVTDPAAIATYDVDSTPAILTVQKTVKSTGKVPKPEVIKEWLKDLRL
ncbi:MAG: thioredoxin family protein [Verrucomicrobia bacterium]|nr:thioredoxin family protein [Verrucomicrobiota bacterium]